MGSIVAPNERCCFFRSGGVGPKGKRQKQNAAGGRWNPTTFEKKSYRVDLARCQLEIQYHAVLQLQYIVYDTVDLQPYCTGIQYRYGTTAVYRSRSILYLKVLE